MEVAPGSGRQDIYLSNWQFNQEANKSIVGVPKIFVNASKAKGESFHSVLSSKFLDSSSASTFSTPGI